MTPQRNTPKLEDLGQEPNSQDQVIQELQELLAAEIDARLEDRFMFIVAFVILLNIVLFPVMPNIISSWALFIFELLILIPLARRMGVYEIVQIMSRVLDRVAGSLHNRKE